MATGQFSLPDYIGQDYSGLNVKTIMEEAKERGMSVGVVTDVYVTDATPAAFLSHARISAVGQLPQVLERFHSIDTSILSRSGVVNTCW